jgi:hypothetical protein
MLAFPEDEDLCWSSPVRDTPTTGATAEYKEHGMLHRLIQLVQRWQPPPAPPAPQPSNSLHDSLEFAWRIHDTITEQSGRLDIKAPITLTLETAAAAAVVVTTTGKGSLLADLRGPRLLLLSVAAGLLLSAIILAALVVTPAVSPRLHWPWSGSQRFESSSSTTGVRGTGNPTNSLTS